MSYTPIYTRKNFVNNSAPAINATNLNDIEDALVSLENGLQTAAADTDTNTAAITTINGEISDLNNLIDEILPDDSASGNPAVITDAFGGSCKSLKLTLEPIQSGSGTPSPQNVRPISGRTQAEITRTGKNILPITLENIKAYNTAGTWNGNEYTALGITFTVNTNADGDVTSIKMNGTCNASYNAALYLTQPNFIKNDYKGKILNGCYTGAYSTYFLYVSYSNDGTTWANEARQSTVDYTISSSYDYVGFSAMVYKGNTVNNVYVYPMVRESSSDASFEPYNGESITRTYGTTIYGGTDDVTGDGAVSSWEIVDLGDLTWTNLYTDRFYSNELTPRKANSNAVCSCFAKNATEVSTIDGLTANMTFAFQSTNDFRIIIRDSSYSSADAFKTAMSGMKLAYEVASPTSIPLTAQNITLLHGDNVLTTDADSIEASYSADIALYIAKQLGGNLGNRGAKSAPADESADDTKEEEKTDEKITEPVTKEAKK